MRIQFSLTGHTPFQPKLIPDTLQRLGSVRDITLAGLTNPQLATTVEHDNIRQFRLPSGTLQRFRRCLLLPLFIVVHSAHLSLSLGWASRDFAHFLACLTVAFLPLSKPWALPSAIGVGKPSSSTPAVHEYDRKPFPRTSMLNLNPLWFTAPHSPSAMI